MHLIVGNVNKNRNVSKNEKGVIEISKHDARDGALERLMTTKEKVKDNNKRKLVKWKDELEQNEI